jgi:2-dehydro-3-deoxyphosphogluconate aldolase/(4S)-4-hydroxy-2-oxoglutarate aldolase
MARFTRLEVLNAIVGLGVVPVFYDADVETAKNVARACAAGGARVFEFTNRGDFAPEVFKALSAYIQKELPGVILGVGSVVDEATAALYIAYGANFVVGPILNPAVAKMCNRRKIAYAPGCGSATEISQAEELGVEIVKVFPGDSVGGPQFVKAVLGPCPWTRIMPTGGVEVTQESFAGWFNAGVAAVGVGSNLMKKEWIKAGKWDDLSAKVREALGWVQELRGVPLFLGVEHVGLYPTATVGAAEIAGYYQKRFGLEPKEGRSSYFSGVIGRGRLEIMKEALTDRCHIAVRVSDFEKALGALQAQGVAFEEPKIKPDVKAVFLKETDPAGNLVHLFWTAE